jgi:antitoxin component of MazEF toxin-antitoxin module
MSSETGSIIKLDTLSRDMATSFEAKPKKWGNSLGIVLPAEFVKENNIDTKKTVHFLVLPADNSDLKAVFGMFKGKTGIKTTQEELDEIDEELYGIKRSRR